MFAIAFDLVVAETARYHSIGVSQPYADIGSFQKTGLAVGGSKTE